MLDLRKSLDSARVLARRFLDATAVGSDGARLTPNAEPTPFALCFHIFLAHLLRCPETLAADAMSVKLRSGLRELRAARPEVPVDKSYRQLLCFVLSALALLETPDTDPLEDLIGEQLREPLAKQIKRDGCLAGKPGSGNQAMFLAIFVLHSRKYLGVDMQTLIDEWVELHMQSMNRFGFWGTDNQIAHLKFQNGYHQHEILEYLGVDNPRLPAALELVRSLADENGHFAPYPGGGGCYDYDAVFMLTPHGRIPDEASGRLLERTARTLLAEQNADGGFCESHLVRPRSLSKLSGFVRHIWAARGNPGVFRERLRYGLTLQRTKHDRIHTHWSRYSRLWSESNLWDTWFRMLALARIDVAMNPEHARNWGFIDYPGIGYHPSLRAKTPVL